MATRRSSRDELNRFFTLEKIGKSSAVFNTEKLLWLNAHYIREAADSTLARILLEDFPGELNAFGEIAALEEKLTSPNGLMLISLCKQKVKTVKELASALRPTRGRQRIGKLARARPAAARAGALGTRPPELLPGVGKAPGNAFIADEGRARLIVAEARGSAFIRPKLARSSRTSNAPSGLPRARA